jgi:hypothetical protein
MLKELKKQPILHKSFKNINPDRFSILTEHKETGLESYYRITNHMNQGTGG